MLKSAEMAVPKTAFEFKKKTTVNNSSTTTYTYPVNIEYVYITTSAASLAITFPQTGATDDGKLIAFAVSTAVATSTYVAGTGSATIVGFPASLTANQIYRFVYDHATTQWLPY